MPVGPNEREASVQSGGRRSHGGKIATGQLEGPKPQRREAGLARARPLTPESRSEIARKAVERWFEQIVPIDAG